MGDFNIDLLKYDSETSSNQFYDLLSSYGYRPLIMQPSRVTPRSATLIDNIFVSDHLPQFCQINIFHKQFNNNSPKFGRNYTNFNKNEFSDELHKINWVNVLQGNSTENGLNKFFLIIEHLLDEMAPVKRLTKKQIRLRDRPWITIGILISMSNRDKTYNLFIKEKDTNKKTELFTLYKKKRNMIISLLRRSKKDYYSAFFEEHKSNVKKTWEGIRNIVNINKRKNTPIAQLVYKNEVKSTNLNMAESMNDFYVNVGNMIETKIPKCDTNFSDYLINPNPKNIFLRPVVCAEVITLVKQFQTSKACGPNSIPVNILKSNINVLSVPLEIILNNSLVEGVFPNLLKLANVWPIFKPG